jgi:hypothetical protein
MTELDALKQLWQEPAGSQEFGPVSEEEFTVLIQARSADVRQRTMERVRAESYTYMALVVFPALMLFMSRGLTLRAALWSLAVIAALAPIIAALAYKEYRLRTLPLGGSVRESLARLVAAIDSTSRFYMSTYMLCVTAGVAFVEGLLLWRFGVSWIPATALLGGTAFLVWACRSGQAYVRKMFGDGRAELMDCLRELDGT